MEVVWIVVVWFLLRQLVWARNGIGELFLVMLCNQKEGFHFKPKIACTLKASIRSLTHIVFTYLSLIITSN